MSPFAKGFTWAVVAQLGLVAVAAVGLVAGGPGANPFSYLIATLGMAVLGLMHWLGITSIIGEVPALIAAVGLLVLLVGCFAGLVSAEVKRMDERNRAP